MYDEARNGAPDAADITTVGRLEVETLVDGIVTLVERISTGTYELLVLIGEADERGVWAIHGALSCASWIARLSGVELSTAHSQVRVARALRRFPELNRAMRSGDVSYAKARVLAAHLTSENAAELVDLASRTPAGRLGAAIAAWSMRNEDQRTITDRRHEARSVTWRTDPDGMVTITARLEPVPAGRVCALIDHRVLISSAPAGASLPQQRADALAGLMTATGPDESGSSVSEPIPGQPKEHGPESTMFGPAKRVDTEIVIHVRGDGNTLADGTPVADHEVVRLIPESFISLLITDSRRRPVDASPRRRHPTRRQRRILDELYPVCANPGCGVATFLQYDHKKRYSDGGLTVIDNLQRLCGPHNRGREAHSPETRGEDP